MSLDSLVQVTIVSQTAGVTRQGFGVPLIAAYHTAWPERVRTYTKPADMLTDGFTAGHAAYRAAQALKSQVPCPPLFKVGKLTSTPNAQVETLVPTAANLTKYSLDIADEDGTLVTFNFTSDGTATVAEIVGALLTAVNADAGLAVTASGGVTDLVLTADVAGRVFALRAYDNGSGHLWTRTLTAADPGYATDLAAILVADPAWFGLTIDLPSDPIVGAVASWAESNRKLFGFTTGDTACKTAAVGGGDVIDDRKTANQAFSWGIYSDRPYEHAAAGLLGRMLPLDPGRGTFAHKTLRGVSTVPLTPTHVTNLEGKNGMWYQQVGGKGITFPGKSGSGEWLDVTWTIEWLKARLQEEWFHYLTKGDKVPFTDKGIAGGEAVIRSVWDEGVRNDALNDDLVVTVPKAKDVSAVDRANRVLSGVSFSGTVQGAIHTLQIQGKVAA